jgi:hypothetical protein
MTTEINKLTESLIDDEKTSIKYAKYIGGLKGLQKLNSNSKKTNCNFLLNCLIKLQEHDPSKVYEIASKIYEENSVIKLTPMSKEDFLTKVEMLLK